MTPRFVIIGKILQEDGSYVITELFTWCRPSGLSGVAKAHADASAFGIILLECWAEPIH